MTDSDNKNTWSTKPNWIKEVLAKTGTELMEITVTSTSKNGAVRKKINVKTEKEDSTNKMVYYQSMPLIIKTEQPSQAQYCTPFGNGSSSAAATTNSTSTTLNTNMAQTQHLPQHQQLNFAQHFGMNSSSNITEAVMQQHSQQQQPKSITNTSTNGNSNSNSNSNGNGSGSNLHFTNTLPLNTNNVFLNANIKTENLPPGLTIFSGIGSSNCTDNVGNGNANSSPAADLSTAPGCSTAIASTSAAAARKSAAINKPKFKCGECGMQFGSKSAHTSHTKSHAKGGKMLQDMVVDMPLGIPKKPLIQPHYDGGDPYRCNVCQKTFAVPARLIRHYRTHTGERPFECEWCHKLFSVKENLQVHRRIHTKERPYQCKVCDRAFEHSGKLHRHNRIHTGERPHGCTLCEKTFIQSGQLVIHMRTHTGEKPYKCPVEGCGKGFTCSKQLKVHSRTHTGEKPYQCDICQREFGYNHVLKLHRMQHYGSKCYKCTICDDTFKSKKEMEAHIKRHANQLPEGQGSMNGSAPSSPQVPTTSGQQQQQQQQKKTVPAKKAKSKKGAASPRPAASQSPSLSLTYALSPTRPATASPSITSATASPSMTFIYETEETSNISSHSNNNQLYAAAIQTAMETEDYATAEEEEMPTDLRVTHSPRSYSNNDNLYQQQQQQPQHAATYTFLLHSPQPTGMAQQEQLLQQQPTINPALLEAASIAKRMAQVNIADESDAETQAALQIMQLHRSQQQQQQFQKQHLQQLQQQQEQQLRQQQRFVYDDTNEANQLIEHYKRGQLARHGIHKVYAAPVPKFESSLLNNEIIVRQVEAAIAPMRSSTESPERASSPESDTNMMMADRDVMTLPLRKRKVYMNEGPRSNTPNQTGNVNGNGSNGSNVMRMSSVIQFAKAS